MRRPGRLPIRVIGTTPMNGQVRGHTAQNPAAVGTMLDPEEIGTESVAIQWYDGCWPHLQGQDPVAGSS